MENGSLKKNEASVEKESMLRERVLAVLGICFDCSGEHLHASIFLCFGWSLLFLSGNRMGFLKHSSKTMFY